MNARESVGPRVILVGGGAQAGKSRFAWRYAQSLGKRPIYVATAQGMDDEMVARIELQRQERGATCATMEVPLDLPEALAALGNADADVVVVDCLTLWLSNLLGIGLPVAAVLERVDRLTAVLFALPMPAIVVSSEVGIGLVPAAASDRSVREVSGLCHQRVARIADEIYVGLMGLMVRLAPAPMRSFRLDEIPPID